MAFARCCGQRTIPLWTMGVEIELLSVEGGYDIPMNPFPVCVTNISRKGNLSSCSFSIVNTDKNHQGSFQKFRQLKEDVRFLSGCVTN